MNGSVSRSLWIYFVVMVPLTIGVVWAWFAFDKAAQRDVGQHSDQKEQRISELEKRITDRIRRRTGARVMTGGFGALGP